MIAGMPVTGKTTLMRNIRAQLGFGTPSRFKLLRYEDYPEHVVLGIYDGDVFDGTDKLSMAVTKNAIEFLRNNKKKVLVEGDRLFTKKFLLSAKHLGYNVKITILEVESTLETSKRYAERGSMPDIMFLKGRHTKIQNIRKIFETKLVNSSKPMKKAFFQSFI
jgi:hypothetical protein